MPNPGSQEAIIGRPEQQCFFEMNSVELEQFITAMAADVSGCVDAHVEAHRPSDQAREHFKQEFLAFCQALRSYGRGSLSNICLSLTLFGKDVEETPYWEVFEIISEKLNTVGLQTHVSLDRSRGMCKLSVG